MKTKGLLVGAICGLGLFCSGAATADDSIKIGLMAPMSGVFGTYGTQIERGIRLYLRDHGERIDGRPVRIIKKDTMGVNPARSKRLARDLILKDHVDILAGFAVSANTFAAATVATQVKVPIVVMNGAASNLTTQSPYVFRTAQTERQEAAPMGLWAAQNGIKTVYMAVADFSPGIESSEQFKETFEKNGGKVIGSVRIPLSNSDPSPYLQRIKDARPDAVFAFFTPGRESISFVRGFQDLGLKKAGIKVIATSISDEGVLDATGDAALGIITAMTWSQVHDSPENRKYVAEYRKKWSDLRPNYMSVSGYDGMQLIDRVLKKNGGETRGPAFAKAAEGMSWTSPRGPVSIDPATHDIVQNIYIREVKKVDGKLQNVEFHTFKNTRDPVEK